MIELDTSLLAPEITYVLMLRGAQLPALEWAERANEAAKRHLESMDDIGLFGRTTLAKPDLGLAVRSLLYLWNGWLQEAVDAARPVPNPERHYLIGLCHRQAGQAAEAKTVFQTMGSHPIYAPLAEYAVETIRLMGRVKDKTLIRFRQIMEFDPVWEPFAFIDLYELARAQKLDRISVEVVRTLQCREWEMLFTQCYEAAVGESLLKIRTAQSPELDRKRRLERRAQDAKRRSRQYALDEMQKQKLEAAIAAKAEKAGQSRPSPVKPRPSASGKPEAPPVPSLSVVCPVCAHCQRVPESLRGQPTRCGRCGASYRVPAGKPVAPGAGNP